MPHIRISTQHVGDVRFRLDPVLASTGSGVISLDKTQYFRVLTLDRLSSLTTAHGDVRVEWTEEHHSAIVVPFAGVVFSQSNNKMPGTYLRLSLFAS
jgi:hypothetical protein